MMIRTVLSAAAVLVASAGIGAAQDAAASSAGDDAALPGADTLPEGTVQLSPVIPAMGEHWGNPADMPLGPLYCVHDGKIVCLEFMISQEDLQNGKSWPDLAGMKGLPPVDHVSVGFEATGHEGYEVPHYDIHMYFITPDEVAAIK